MAFQFVRLECYARKKDTKGRDVAFVLDEVARTPGACEHVENPQAPTVIFGESPCGVRAMHDEMVAAGFTTDVKGHKRKIRVDQCTLATLVISHPGEEEGDVNQWQAKTVEWLKNRYGSDLVSVVRHDDESHPHLHAYVLPVDLKARNLHPGVQAKMASMKESVAEGLDTKAANKAGNNSYKRAMREFQDDYWREVGIACGLARLGPGRRRLSRDAWQAEQAVARNTAELLKVAEQAEAKIEVAAEKFGSIKDQAKAARAAQKEAEEALSEALNLKSRAEKTLEKLTKMIEKAKAELDSIHVQYQRVGSKVRGVFAGFLEASPEKLAEEIIEKERSDWKHRESDLLNENEKVFKENRILKIEKRQLVDRVQELATQNSALLQMGHSQDLKNGSRLKV